jgi:hypothetical protein
MGYDLCAQTSMEEKERFLDAAAKEQWIVVFEHDAQTPAARIELSSDGKYRALLF